MLLRACYVLTTLTYHQFVCFCFTGSGNSCGYALETSGNEWTNCVQVMLYGKEQRNIETSKMDP